MTSIILLVYTKHLLSFCVCCRLCRLEQPLSCRSVQLPGPANSATARVQIQAERRDALLQAPHESAISLRYLIQSHREVVLQKCAEECPEQLRYGGLPQGAVISPILFC